MQLLSAFAVSSDAKKSADHNFCACCRCTCGVVGVSKDSVALGGAASCMCLSCVTVVSTDYRDSIMTLIGISMVGLVGGSKIVGSCGVVVVVGV